MMAAIPTAPVTIQSTAGDWAAQEVPGAQNLPAGVFEWPVFPWISLPAAAAQMSPILQKTLPLHGIPGMIQPSAVADTPPAREIFSFGRGMTAAMAQMTI